MKKCTTMACLTGAVTLALFITGCQELPPSRSDVPSSGAATRGPTQRSPKKSGEEFFFNEKSRDIEKSLGL